MKIAVIGLGYVGLPLAVALSKRFDTWGFDIDLVRVAELRDGRDRTNEISAQALADTTLMLTSSATDVPTCDVYIVTVPTPIDDNRQPDLGPVRSATRTIAKMIDPARRPVIVYESTVYPGVTEDICGPLLEEVGGLLRGRDFTLGYSPERINPGDREHTVDRIVKVLAGEDEATTARLEEVYGAVTSAGTFRAASIRAAEAAKVIENTQRDINIAFMNEVTKIFSSMQISIWDVLEAARTKWNFLPFEPGLVGGHCIGIDPYYLSYRAQELGYNPKVILAGREMNDGMGDWIAGQIAAASGRSSGTALVLGLTFKENVPDLRNSKAIDVIRGLRARGFDVTVHDAEADAAEAAHEYDVALDEDALTRSYDVVVCAVAHDFYRAMGTDELTRLVNKDGLIADIKQAWPFVHDAKGLRYWRL